MLSHRSFSSVRQPIPRSSDTSPRHQAPRRQGPTPGLSLAAHGIVRIAVHRLVHRVIGGRERFGRLWHRRSRACDEPAIGKAHWRYVEKRKPIISVARFNEGDAITLKASPVSGQTFAGWSDDAEGFENPLTVVMDESKIITAKFREGLPPKIGSRIMTPSIPPALSSLATLCQAASGVSLR